MEEELTYVGVGSDRFRAEVIVRACRAAGLKVELLTGDDSGVDPHLGMVQGHRLLVRVADLDRVRAILEGTSGPRDGWARSAKP